MSAATPTSACTPMTRALAVFLIAATASSSASLPRATMATSAPDCGKARRDREADALAAAGDDGGTARKTDFHDDAPTIPHDRDRAIPSVVGEPAERVIRAFLRATMRWIFLPDDALTGSSSSSSLGRAVERLADQRALEGRVEPAVRVALVGAVGDAPAQVKNAAGLEDGEQAAHRVAESAAGAGA